MFEIDVILSYFDSKYVPVHFNDLMVLYDHLCVHVYARFPTFIYLKLCLNWSRHSKHIIVYFIYFLRSLEPNAPQMVCQQCVETRKWGTQNSLITFLLDFASQLTIAMLIQPTLHSPYITSQHLFEITQTFDDKRLA